MPNDFAPWPGTIYTAAMYSYVLSTAEVAANYAAGDQCKLLLKVSCLFIVEVGVLMLELQW
jgi:hypothetical protein